MQNQIGLELKKIEDILNSIKTQQTHKKITKMEGLLSELKIDDKDIEEAKKSVFKFGE